MSRIVTISANIEITMDQIAAPGFMRERWIDHSLDEAAGDTRRIEKLAEKIGAEGFDAAFPVVLLDMEDGDFAVVNGRHRILAARLAHENGWCGDEIKALIVTEEEWAAMPECGDLRRAEYLAIEMYA
jgi:hypothetical protein